MSDIIRRALESTSQRYAAPYRLALADLLAAEVVGDRTLARDARERFRAATRETMGIASVLGASQGLARAAEAIRIMESRGREFFRAKRLDQRERLLRFASDSDQRVVPRVTFQQALDDLITRSPATVRDAAERTHLRISELYSEGRVIAFAKAAEDTVTRQARETIATAVRDGVGERRAGTLISADVDSVRKATAQWTEAYSRLAFRNNFSTAATAGRFAQLRDPAIARILPAFEYITAGDSDVRDNHAPLDGMILSARNPAWQRLAPPLGHNCRCDIVEVPLPFLEDRGLIAPDGSVIESRIPSVELDSSFRPGGRRPDLI